MKKFNINFMDYNNNPYLKLEYEDFSHIYKYGYNQINFDYISFGSLFDKYYNHSTDYSINNDKYYKAFIRYINYLNNNFYNISFKLNYGSLYAFIVTKKKNFKTFLEYQKDKKYYRIYKQLRENKKNFKNIDLFNSFICKKTHYDKYFGLYQYKKNQIEKTIKAIEEKKLDLLKISYDNFILYNYDENNRVKNTNRIIFYKNGIGIYDKLGKVIKTFSYKNDVNVIDYIKL